MEVHKRVEETLLALLYAEDTENGTWTSRRRDLATAFEASLIEITGVPENASRLETLACVRRSVNSFIADPTPTPLETFFLHVVTILHCYTVVASANVGSSQLPVGVKRAAVAIASAFFSQRLRAACMETNNNEDVVNSDTGEDDDSMKSTGGEAGGQDDLLQELHELWFCFLCIFLQQLSAKGGDFTVWRQFFRTCAAQHKTSDIKKESSRGAEDYMSGEDGSREEERIGISAWGAVSEETFNATVARTRFRRTAILCKSFCPHLVAQAPGTTYQLLHTLHAFMSDWMRFKKEKSNDGEVNEEEAIVGRYSEQMGQILGEGQVHAFLLSTAIGAVLSSTYILSTRGARGGETARWHSTRPDTAWQTETQWRQTHFPPIGRLLERLHIRSLLGVHLFAFCMQLCIGLSPTHHTEGRQKLAIYLYLTEVCSLHVALAIYHFAPLQFPQGMLEETATVFPGEGIASLTAAVDDYVQKAHSELIFSAVDAGTTRRRHRHNAHAVNNGQSNEEEELIPVNGELTGPRFAKMVFPVSCPTWGQYLAETKPTGATTTMASSSSTSAQTTNALSAMTTSSRTSVGATGAFVKQTTFAQSVTPCRFVLDLCEIGLPGLMAETITQMRTEMGMNVCLVPSVALPGVGSIPRKVLQRVQAFLSNKEEEKEKDEKNNNKNNNNKSTLGRYTFSATLRALETYFPLLSTIYAYVASQAFLCCLVEIITRECDKLLHFVHEEQEGEYTTMNKHAEDTNYGVACRNALGLAERYLIHVVMPCMRVLAPSPILYGRVQALFLLMKEKGPGVKFGVNPAEFLHMNAWLHWLLRPTSVCDRAPHDVLRSKELEALFAQSLKRMTQSNVAHYRNLLQPVIYANPLLVAKKLFQQAVGYGNNFLQIHTQLLKGAPAAVLTLVAHEGLSLMRQYAEEERIGTADANRVGLIATFLSVLWRDNPHSFDGGVLLRAAEYALRREARASIVFGLELLRSILHEMLDLTLEHEEQYSVAQLKALLAPSSTQWFAKGAAESFRRGRWNTSLTPAILAAATSMLRLALQEEGHFPVENEEPEEDEEEGEEEERDMHRATKTATPQQRHDDEGKGTPTVKFTLGQCLLLHLCRLHSRIYTVQADLAGTMQLVLLTCARDYNVINDLLLCMVTIIPQGPPEEEIFMVAMPHVALRITARFAVKEAQRNASIGKRVLSVDALFNVTPSEIMSCVDRPVSVTAIDTVIPFSILQKLSYYTAAHFVFDESVYTAATNEVNQFHNHATALVKRSTHHHTGIHNNTHESDHVNNNSSAGGSPTTDPTIRWLQEQLRQIRLEKEAHQELYQKCEAARTALLEELRCSGVLAEPVVFATSYLLPRALLSLEDTLFVYHFMKWLLNVTKTNGNDKDGCGDYERVVDIVLSLITATMTFFVGFTDGECKRVGFLLALLRAALHETTVDMPPFPSVNDAVATSTTTSGGAADVPLPPVTLTTEALMALLEPKPRTFISIFASHAAGTTDVANGVKEQEEANSPDEKDAIQAAQAALPAFPIQLEAYLCRALVHLLLHQREIPFLHRNALLVLERLTKNTPAFPSTLCATEWLIKAITPHAVRSSSCYASATAVLKVLKGNRHRMEETLGLLASRLVLQTGPPSKNGVEKQIEAWQKLWKEREAYVRFLLLDDIAAAERRGETEVVVPANIGGMGFQVEKSVEDEAADIEEVEAGAPDDDDDNVDDDYANGIHVDIGEEQDARELQEEAEDDDVAGDHSELSSSSLSECCDNEESDVCSEQQDEETVEEEILATDIPFNDELSLHDHAAMSHGEGMVETSGENDRKRSRDEERDASESPPRTVSRLETHLKDGEENV
ncbi:helicase, putative [Trypanosoma cruzi marinkellei]|uniref:Helicase, putative n=1 Tax=Trypanosoma cruzi marinkellei TaxID=85056 RepID=K2M5M0_TRYCR|nr:helicase, putative [Trypanosoma cruzi marinkellei]